MQQTLDLGARLASRTEKAVVHALCMRCACVVHASATRDYEDGQMSTCAYIQHCALCSLLGIVCTKDVSKYLTKTLQYV